MYSRTCKSVSLHFLCCLLVGLPASGALVAQESSQQTDLPSQWVSGLSDSDPQVRRLAESKILAGGGEVLPALESGVQSFDLEVSSRCSVLLEKIRLREIERISKLFLVEDKPVDPSLKLAAWPEFSAFVGGDDLPVRKMFLRMCHKLPVAFEDYGVRGQQSAEALAETAVTVLGKGKESEADSLSAGIAFLFLTDLAAKKRDQDASERLFDDAQMNEFIAFFTSGSFPRRASRDSRPAFQRLIADWVLQQNAAGFVSDSSLFRFVNSSRNKVLLQHLKDKYDSFNASQKLKFIDLVTVVVTEADGKDGPRLYVWLEDALLDDTLAIRTRRKKNPANELAVTVRMLVQGILAKAIKEGLATGELVKSEGVFGNFEFSRNSFLIVAEEQEQKRLEEYFESNLNRE